MKKLIIIVLALALLVPWVSPAWGATYYLLNGGAGTKDGTSLANAFGAAEVTAKSLATGFAAGDVIKVYDDAGDITGSSVYATKTHTMSLAGNGTAESPIILEAADGETPVFTGFANYSTGWVDEGGNIWYHALPNNDEVGFVMFGAQNQESVGVWSNLKTDLDANKDYWTDVVNSRIYVYADADPATKWTNVYLPVNDSGIDSYETLDNNYWIVRGLTIKGYNALGIRFSSTIGTRIYGNTLSWVGGRRSTGTSRLGNGIQIDRESSYAYLYNNNVSQVFDSGIGPHQYSDNTMEYLYIYDNIVDKCGAGIESSVITSTTPIIRHAWIYNNQVTNSGYGWSGTENSKHGQGINVGGNVDGCLYDDVYIFDNYVDTFAYVGISYSQTNGKAYIYNNEITGGTLDYTGATTSAMMVHGKVSTDTLRDVTGDIWGNYIHDNLGHGIYTVNNQSEVNYYNNTLVNNGSGTTYYSLYSLANTGDVYTNNIVVNTDTRCVFDSNTSQSTYDYNLYYRTDGGVIGRYASVDRATVTDWQTATGMDANGTGVNPKLTANGYPGRSSLYEAGTDISGGYYFGNNFAIGYCDKKAGLLMPWSIALSIGDTLATPTASNGGKLYTAATPSGALVDGTSYLKDGTSYLKDSGT